MSVCFPSASHQTCSQHTHLPSSLPPLSLSLSCSWLIWAYFVFACFEDSSHITRHGLRSSRPLIVRQRAVQLWRGGSRGGSRRERPSLMSTQSRMLRDLRAPTTAVVLIKEAKAHFCRVQSRNRGAAAFISSLFFSPPKTLSPSFWTYFFRFTSTSAAD